MAVVTVSSKFQIAIPRSIREKIGLKPKEKLVMIEKGGIITLIPQLPIKEMKGFAKGVQTRDIRDESDRF
ncbi:MAG: AbrB family transcriptional regulator [Candidatus Syntrophoarchaeum caldarius]|uniref:AbrB family transcriptional regulator n=1 Tax=Candidatus Syntropharchaeum caldarium TaxID=1838285 RepID=A0A1F2P7C8_9EURY|nr:MAG: AbrB family transcriptional regulator [Candidatus Syntrophoarchaeum caldarius]